MVLLLLVALLLPGMFCFGNLMRESGVVERLSDTVQNGLINIVTIFLSVGAKLVAGGRWAFCCWCCVRYRDGGRGADGEAAEPVHKINAGHSAAGGGCVR